MTPFCLILVVLIQGSFTLVNCEDDDATREILKKPEFEDNVVKEFQGDNKDWIDLFLESTPSLYPSHSVALMAHVTSSDKSPEEQVDDIKAMVHQITQVIESEMTNLLTDAIAHCAKGEEHTKRKRSIETPMDSSQRVMRLLRHIKSNNEYQNIAIEKMMSAQEIADKYGVKYSPEEDVLADLAAFSSKQSEELSSILSGTSPNDDQIEYVPLKDKEEKENPTENSTYYVYSMHIPEEEIQSQFNSYPPHEYMPEQVHFKPQPPVQQHNRPHAYHSYNFPETQIPAPPHHAQSVQRPFYEQGFTPAPEYYHPCGPKDPVTTTTTIVLPYDEPVAPEPELVGQVYEETVTNKVYIEQGDEPGSTDVNHVMTYTVSEKSHFKTPEIEKLPQQMQYYFFLMN